MNNKEILKSFFTIQNPLGDIAAVENMHDEASQLLFKSYFDRENQPIQELELEPSMIVGRKGSGKTDALLSYEFGNPSVVRKFGPTVYFEAVEAAATISSVINQITDAIYANYPQPRVEEVASFWDTLFWVTILCGILNENIDKGSHEHLLIQKYIGSLFDEKTPPASPYHTLVTTIVKLRCEYANSQYINSGISFFGAQGLLTFTDLTIADAKVAGLSLLRKNKKIALILFDSIEALELEEDDNRLAISGLLKTVGSFHDTGASAQFRCCIPAESYFKLTSMSQNVLKDFRKLNRLQWNSAELLRICALRYKQFLVLHAPDVVEETFSPYNDFKHRKDVIEFWHSILPPRIPNTRRDTTEATLPYITRHSQLLPRHIILLLNSILASTIRDSGVTEPSSISTECVRESIKATEPLMIAQILDSYKSVWPDAESAILDVLPHIQKNVIPYSELHRYFNRSNAATGSHKNIHSYDDFLRMLCELGAIGRLIETTDNYAVAVFEYSEPSRLIFTSMDTLCVHPIFSGHYRVVSDKKSEDNYMPVYPIGTDPKSSYFSS